MVRRIIAAVIALLVYGWAIMAYTPQATLITGDVTGRQFENSDSAYLTAVYTMSIFSTINVLLTLALLGVLALLWFKPVRDLIKQTTTRVIVLFATTGALLAGTTGSKAFFDKTDKTEAYTILPNQSAFWIPDVGANLANQAQMDSEAFYNANRVQLKRFVVPHQKLQGSAGNSMFSGWDYYVPAGRLIIVDRTPYSREWVDARDRGTSDRKEGFPCQSKEGLNIGIGVSVAEANAAKYLYRFGVIPPKGDPAGGDVIFISVYYSRSVRDVMDDVGRKKVQTLVCDEIAGRTFDDANANMKAIMEKVKTEATNYFASVGITLDFIGYADTWTFDDAVQAAINRRYVASQDKEIALALEPYTATIQGLAAAQALRSFGDKSDGKLPTTIVGLPTNAQELLSGLLRAPGTVTAPARALTH
jgi:hypothetical protein